MKDLDSFFNPYKKIKFYLRNHFSKKFLVRKVEFSDMDTHQ